MSWLCVGIIAPFDFPLHGPCGEACMPYLCSPHRDKPNKPFRCLDPQYRRELVRVYLSNVEGVCRRFCEDKRARLVWVKDETAKFKEFWSTLSSEQQRKVLTEKGEIVLKVGGELVHSAGTSLAGRLPPCCACTNTY